MEGLGGHVHEHADEQAGPLPLRPLHKELWRSLHASPYGLHATNRTIHLYTKGLSLKQPGNYCSIFGYI